MVCDQLGGERFLVELREHEHADLREPAAQLDRGSQAVVLVPGRHANVGHDNIRAVRKPLSQQILGVRGLRDDLVLSQAAVEKHVTAIMHKLGIGPTQAGHRRVLAVLAYLRARQ